MCGVIYLILLNNQLSDNHTKLDTVQSMLGIVLIGHSPVHAGHCASWKCARTVNNSLKFGWLWNWNSYNSGLVRVSSICYVSTSIPTGFYSLLPRYSSSIWPTWANERNTFWCWFMDAVHPWRLTMIIIQQLVSIHCVQAVCKYFWLLSISRSAASNTGEQFNRRRPSNNGLPAHSSKHRQSRRVDFYQGAPCWGSGPRYHLSSSI